MECEILRSPRPMYIYTYVYIYIYGTDHSQRREYPRVVCGPSACRVRVEFVSCPGRVFARSSRAGTHSLILTSRELTIHSIRTYMYATVSEIDMSINK